MPSSHSTLPNHRTQCRSNWRELNLFQIVLYISSHATWLWKNKFKLNHPYFQLFSWKCSCYCWRLSFFFFFFLKITGKFKGIPGLGICGWRAGTMRLLFGVSVYTLSSIWLSICGLTTQWNHFSGNLVSNLKATVIIRMHYMGAESFHQFVNNKLKWEFCPSRLM